MVALKNLWRCETVSKEKPIRRSMGRNALEIYSKFQQFLAQQNDRSCKQELYPLLIKILVNDFVVLFCRVKRDGNFTYSRYKYSC